MTAREVALEVLTACRRQGAWADGKLKSETRRAGLSSEDAALASRIVYGVMQNMTLLDFYIGQFCSVRPKKLEPRVLDILRLSAYQLVFLTRIPSSAAVNEAVELTRQYGNPRAAGLVNGTLRALARCEELPRLNCETKEEYFSVQYSHPQWLVREFLDRLGPEQTRKLLAADNEIAPLVVQVNPLAAGVEEAVAALEADGVTVRQHEKLPGCLELTGAGSVERLRAFQEGMIRVQDAAAAMSVAVGAPRPGETVIDGCSAPGGKSFAAAALMEDRGEIFSFDVHPHKIKLIQKSTERLKIHIVRAACLDARRVRETMAEAADLVIADVPCSGLGTIRKKPDIRWKDPEQFRELPALQMELLNALADCVRPGGRLLYSTCTLRRQENEDVVARFLAEHEKFSLEAFETPLEAAPEGMLTFWPQVHGTDGFFVALLRRQNG